VGPYLIAVLRFLFAPRPGRPGPVTPPPEPPRPTLSEHAPDGWVPQWLAAIFAWGAVAVLAVTAIAVVGALTYLLVRWLFSRTTVAPRHAGRARTAWPGAARLRELFARLVARLRPARRAAEVYRRLLGWGRRSGIRPLRTETPSEFGAKLQRSFPKVRREIALIVDAFNCDVYGGGNGAAAPAALAAWRHVRSPRHWPSRLHRWWRGA
jgi:hypothetical protein